MYDVWVYNLLSYSFLKKCKKYSTGHWIKTPFLNYMSNAFSLFRKNIAINRTMVKGYINVWMNKKYELIMPRYNTLL